MPRGEHRPNGAGRVDRDAFARLGRELSQGFPQMDDETDRLVNTRVVGPAVDEEDFDNSHRCTDCGVTGGGVETYKGKNLCEGCATSGRY